MDYDDEHDEYDPNCGCGCLDEDDTHSSVIVVLENESTRPVPPKDVDVPEAGTPLTDWQRFVMLNYASHPISPLFLIWNAQRYTEESNEDGS